MTSRYAKWLRRWSRAAQLSSGRGWAAIVMAVAAASCSSAESRLPTDTPPDTTGGVQRASLTISLRPSPAAAPVAAALGWAAGAVPGGTVTITRIGSSTPISKVTDETGAVVFPDLLPGTYLLSAVRLLNASERSALPAGIDEVDALGGAGSLSLSAPDGSLDVSMTASQRGSLVISEVWSGEPLVGSTYYDYGDYFEIYNNSDAAVPLADKIVLAGFPGTFNNPDLSGCTASAPFQRDSLGIWATFIYAFPPSAPHLPAGGAILLATDAIDHTSFTPLVFDLRTANYEFRGGADADNPSVPDMLSIGPSDGGDLSNRGMSFYSSHPVLAVANAVNLPSQPSMLGGGRTWVRIPRDALLDVVTWGRINPSFETCGSPVHASLDAQQARVIDNWTVDLRAITRRAIGSMPDGRAILLRTRSSSNDFVAAQPSPGRVP